MRIAIVAPCPVPYVVGGAEKLWWGLAAHLNEATPHPTEIIKLPSPEHDLASLMRSYEAFSTLDLSGFDLVISGKYPAWMVSHPRHVCYMLHRLRGLYDGYPGATAVPAALAAFPTVAGLRAFMRRYRGERSALPELFGRWGEIASDPGKPAIALDFPGPLARELAHWLDEIALAPAAISRYAAISRTVADRPGYFPEGVEVEVAHPPPHRAAQPGERRDHFFTVSRLDAPKRVELIVRAMARVKTSLPLIVAGTGPEEARLRELAAPDARVRFVGFQGDAEVAQLYRDALAVPFVPFAEDYGLIAAEAMQLARPVITTTDSGGPRELVDDGESGLVCEPTVEAIAAAMQKLADDAALAKRLGERARERSAGITWQAVERALLAPPLAQTAASDRVRTGTPGARRKLVVACTFPIYPPRHGGQSRVFHLYRSLAPEFETTLVTVCPPSQSAFAGEIAPGLREVRVPMTEEHARRDLEIQRRVGTPTVDATMPALHALSPAIAAAIRRESEGAAAIVACHPYLYPALRDLGLPVWYEAQDLEVQLKTALFAGKPGGDELLAAVDAVERDCVAAARVILCAAASDGEELVRRYGADPARIVEAPNGTDALRIAFTDAPSRAALKARLDLADVPMTLFLGSGHPPNIQAVQRVLEFAGRMPDVVFAVIGSVCHAFNPRLVPVNVMFVGEVDVTTRNLCLQVADVALNPMEYGSGTNLKMLDFFAAGIPVIATASGARGLGLEDESACLVRPLDEFPAAIRDVLAQGAGDAAARAIAARERVERDFDWDAIGRRIVPRLVAAAG